MKLSQLPIKISLVLISLLLAPESARSQSGNMSDITLPSPDAMISEPSTQEADTQNENISTEEVEIETPTQEAIATPEDTTPIEEGTTAEDSTPTEEVIEEANATPEETTPTEEGTAIEETVPTEEATTVEDNTPTPETEVDATPEEVTTGESDVVSEEALATPEEATTVEDNTPTEETTVVEDSTPAPEAEGDVVSEEALATPEETTPATEEVAAPEAEIDAPTEEVTTGEGDVVSEETLATPEETTPTEEATTVEDNTPAPEAEIDAPTEEVTTGEGDVVSEEALATPEETTPATEEVAAPEAEIDATPEEVTTGEGDVVSEEAFATPEETTPTEEATVVEDSTPAPEAEGDVVSEEAFATPEETTPATEGTTVEDTISTEEVTAPEDSSPTEEVTTVEDNTSIEEVVGDDFMLEEDTLDLIQESFDDTLDSAENFNIRRNSARNSVTSSEEAFTSDTGNENLAIDSDSEINIDSSTSDSERAGESELVESEPLGLTREEQSVEADAEATEAQDVESATEPDETVETNEAVEPENAEESQETEEALEAEETSQEETTEEATEEEAAEEVTEADLVQLDRVAYETQFQEAPSDLAILMQEEFQLTQFIDSSGLQLYGTVPSVENISRRLSQLAEQTGKRPAFINISLQSNQLESFIVLPDRTLASTANPTVASSNLNVINSQPEEIIVRKTVENTSRKNLMATATEFREEISDLSKLNQTEYLSSARELYRVLIEPLEAELEANDIDILVFSLDSGLRLLPLAALHDGEQFLVEKYAMGIVPSFGLTDTRYVNLNQSSILAMGASEFDEQPPLPTMPIELETVLSDPRQGKSFLNEQFTIDNFVAQNSPETPFSIIHLGTHAEFKAGDLDDSYIQFYNEKLEMPELQQLSDRLGWNTDATPVELLVLSACETALGDEEAELGFAGLAVQAGVKSALASLWYISDLGTLALMGEFYDRLGSSLVKAEALRQTQLQMLQGNVKIDDRNVELSNGEKLALPDNFPKGTLSLDHPYFWSAFTLIGNWN